MFPEQIYSNPDPAVTVSALRRSWGRLFMAVQLRKEAFIGAWPFFAGTAFLLLLVACGMLNHAAMIDESFYLPLARQYSESGFLAPLAESVKAVSSVGPSYYISLECWIRLFGSEDAAIRLFSTFCMIAASGLWFRIGRRMGLKFAGANMLTFFVMPYMAITSICAMAETFMVMNILLFIDLWMIALDYHTAGAEKPARNYFLCCGLPLALAANARPPCIVFGVAFAAVGLVRVRNIWATIGPLVAVVLQIPFWMMWGNIFPPSQRLGMMPEYSKLVGIFPDTTVHLLTVAGLMLWPALSPRIGVRTVLQIASGLALWLYFEPDLTPGGRDNYRFFGPLLKAVIIAPAMMSVYLVPFLAGWMLLWDQVFDTVVNRLPTTRQALVLGVLFFMVGIMRSPLGFDRYAAFFLPFWYLAVADTLEKRPFARGICLFGWISLTALMLANIH